MRNSEQTLASTWVVYKMTQHGNAVGMSAVCEQREWDAMELARPGYHTLVRAGIANEAEAETLARDTSGYVAPVPRARKSKLVEGEPGTHNPDSLLSPHNP